MLVLNMKVNPKKCVAERSTSSDAGIYGTSSKRKETPKKAATRSAVKSTPIHIERKAIEPVEEIVFEAPKIEPVTVTTLTEEEKKYVKMYEKMHKKEIDVSQYKVKTYIAQTKEQAKEKPKPIKRAQPINPDTITPEVINPEEIIGTNIPQDIKKTNWFKRLIEKIKAFFKKLFKRKEKETNERHSEDIDS